MQLATTVRDSPSTRSIWSREMRQGVEAEVAPGFGPFVVLFGQDCAGEADDRGAVGENPGEVGPLPDLPVQAFVGSLDEIWRQISFGNTVNASTSLRAPSRCSAEAGSVSVRASRIRSNCSCTDSLSGWS